MAYLRAQFAQRPFPITCVTYGLSQQYLLWEVFTRLFFTPTLGCDSILCTSHATREALRKIIAQISEGLRQAGMAEARAAFRLDVLPLGVDTDIYCPGDRQMARRLLGLPAGSTIILQFGRVDPSTKSDPAPLLRAFREVASKHGEKVMLVIAGEMLGDHLAAYVRRTAHALGIAHLVELRASPSTTEGPLYYSAADIFVSLSDTVQESYGLAPVEAMASGLPVVVSDWDGYRDTVVHGETGFLVNTCWGECDEEVCLYAPLLPWDECHLRLSQSVAVDLEALVKYLEFLVGNQLERKAMGERARKHVEANLSWKQVIRKYYNLWLELSEASLSISDSTRSCGCLDRPRYFETFSQYATEKVEGGDKLALTPAGTLVCRRKEQLIPYGAMNHTLSQKILIVILNYVRLTRLIKYSPSVQEICEKMHSRYGVSKHAALANVMWLIKQGFLARAAK